MASKPQLSTITFCHMRPCIRIEIYALLEYVAVQKDTKDSKTPAKAQYPVRCVVTCVRPAIPSRRALLQPPANPPRNGVRAHIAPYTVPPHRALLLTTSRYLYLIFTHPSPSMTRAMCALHPPDCALVPHTCPAVLRAFLLPHPLALVPESRVAHVATFSVDLTTDNVVS